MNQQQRLLWDKGSAYDLFVSLWILHRPDEFGLRPSWAAGVRSRLPVQLRDVLEKSQKFISVPLSWINSLPAPKDAAAVLNVLGNLLPEERLPALVFGSKTDQTTQKDRQFLLSLAGKQRLTASVEAQIKALYKNPNKASSEVTRATFEAWADPKTFGEKLFQALDAYVNNFFREEETRIIPAQAKGLKEAQVLAEDKDLVSLLEELSAGVRMDWVTGVSKLVLAPSFWGAPFVFFDVLDQEMGIILFGARPTGMALVPGELIPDVLLNALKALGNPTRLRILRHMLDGPCTPSELSKVLRLRPPTVIHHLHNLRLAGLVRVTVSPESERRYAVRMDGVDLTIQNLQEFLSGE